MEKYDEINKIIKKIKFYSGRVTSNDKVTKEEKLWLKKYIIQSLEDKYNSLNLTESDFDEIASDCQNSYVTFDLKEIKSKYVLKIFYNLLKISLSNFDKLWLLIRIRSDTKIKKLEKVLKKLSTSKIRTALSIIVDDDIESEFEIGTIVVKVPVKNGVLVKCISSSKKVKISSDITEIDGFAFYLNNKVTEIDIPESVTKINNDAFYSCLKLEKIYISKNVNYIGKNVFLNCPNLKVIEIAKDNKSYYSEGNCIIKRKTKTLVAACEGSIVPSGIKRIDDYAFYGFSSLSEVTVPEGVTSIGRCFCSSCRNLKKVIISSSVKEIKEIAFSYSDSLTEIVIPESVESIGVESFIYSDNLCSITFLGANTVIESGCFSDGGDNKITIYCKPKSNAEKFAQSCNIKYKYLS